MASKKTRKDAFPSSFPILPIYIRRFQYCVSHSNTLFYKQALYNWCNTKITFKIICVQVHNDPDFGHFAAIQESLKPF